MLYMLDTNVCIFLVKKKIPQYFARLAQLEKTGTIGISAIVLSELQYGVANSQQKEQSQINLNLLLNKLDVIPYTDKCAFYYGEIRASLKKAGRIIGANDLLIASHAMTENALLITNNYKEFKLVQGLKLEHWEQ